MQVLPFAEQAFAEALSNEHSTPDVIAAKRHFTYFLNYLGPGGLSAQTMVIEKEYVSKDYLHDYASYYAFCFTNYHKFCKRVHFFSSQFSKEDIEKALLNPEPNEFWDHYLGFIVVKPIPITIVGYTVLKVYPDLEGDNRRHFWAQRDYKIHFFGRELHISSLAFQEQDSVLAACATTAIWCMLNKASTDFHTKLKVPSEITKDADVLSTDGSRLFPNKGLDILQICQAINNSGLAPEVRVGNIEWKDAAGDDDIFIGTSYIKRLLNAYELVGIPIILGIKVPTKDGYGYHAVTVSGHKLYASHDAAISTSEFIGDRIEKVYVHDDQYGPFASVKFLDDGVGIESPWTSVHPDKLPTYVVNIVIPLYPKIRISYENIEVIVIALNGIIFQAFEIPEGAGVFWDIKLDYSEGFKKAVITDAIEDSRRLEIIARSMPKYLWVATCYFGGDKFMTFTFDATDVSNGMLGKDIITYFAPEVNAHLHKYIGEHPDDLATLFQTAGGNKYIEHLLKQIK